VGATVCDTQNRLRSLIWNTRYIEKEKLFQLGLTSQEYRLKKLPTS